MIDNPDPVPPILLVGWESATWDLINPLLDQGAMPHLQELVDNGLVATLRTSPPVLAPVVYHSLASGKRPDKHGVLGSLEVGEDGRIALTGSMSRRSKAFWEILSQSGLRCQIVNFPTMDPAETVNGTFVAPRFFGAESVGVRNDSKAARDVVCPADRFGTLDELNVSLAEIDPTVMKALVPRFRELNADDPQLIAIGKRLAKTFSVHAVTTHLMETEIWQLTSVNYPLISDVAAEFLRYHSVPEDEGGGETAHLFADVMSASLHLADMLLGRLLELAGDEAVVIVYSPWGSFLPRQRADELSIGRGSSKGMKHRGEGIFAMRAPGIPGDELLHQVSFLDICPTVLRLAGLPVGEDMDGRVVQDLLEGNVSPNGRISSWDELAPVRSSHGWPTQTALLPQPITFTEKFAQKRAGCIQESNLWNLARSRLATDSKEEALPLLLQLYHANPLQVERGPMVAEALYSCGFLEEAIDIITPLAKAFPDTAVGRFMAGVLQLHQGNLARAVEQLEQAQVDNPPFPRLYYYVGHVYQMMNQSKQAVDAYRRALDLDPGFLDSYLGLSEAYLRSLQFEQAAEAALAAIGCDFVQPAGHIALGRALVHVGELDRAREAYETAAGLEPTSSLAEQHLEMLNNQTPDAAAAASGVARLVTPPLSLKLHDEPTSHVPLQAALDEIRSWRSQFADELEEAERQLDLDLAEKSVATTDTSDNGDEVKTGELVSALRQQQWTLRLAEPNDQFALHQMFDVSSSMAEITEIIVTHPIGATAIHGGVLLELQDDQGDEVTLKVSIGSVDEQVEGEASGPLTAWLLRAGISRALAGGARRVRCVVDDISQLSLKATLEQIGFRSIAVQSVYLMDIAKTVDVGSRMLELFQKRKIIPSDVRRVFLEDLPIERVNSFLQRWFADGTGQPPQSLATWCPVILKGDEIIACCIGYAKTPETFTVTRIGVLPEYRKGWPIPWLFADAARQMEAGHSKMEFRTDESQFPDFVRIAQRRLNAKKTGTLRTLVLDLSRPK